MSERSNNTKTQEKIRFVDYYQTPLNAGTYEVTATLAAPSALQDAIDVKDKDGKTTSPSAKVKLHVAGPRFFLPPSEIHSVFPPENGAGDYNNVLPHIVLNRHTLPWERLVDGKSENIPFLALLLFSEDEEANGDVSPPVAMPLADLSIDLNFKYVLEPGEELTDKVSVIDIKQSLLEQIMPTGEELTLLAHGREQTENGISHQRAVVISKRLPAHPIPMFGIIPDIKQKNKNQKGVLVKSVQGGSVGDKAKLQAGDLIITIGKSDVNNVDDISKAMKNYQLGNNVEFSIQRSEKSLLLTAAISDSDIKRRNIAHLVMLENCYNSSTPKKFRFAENASDPIRLICLKSWQFTCTADKISLRERLQGDEFTFEAFCVPKNPEREALEQNPKEKALEQLRLMSYTALSYHLRWGDKAHTLYRGPFVASSADLERLADKVPVSADGLVYLLQNHHIFDVSYAAAWQLGQMLMLRDQNVAMEYFTWRRRDAQLRARGTSWAKDGHLHLSDNALTGLTAIPATVREWCQERLKLRGLPFEYLVPDARMLPENSLRIFRIHKAWMECLLAGALAVGRGGDSDRLLEADYRAKCYSEANLDLTGFLLRSPAVDEYPDLKVVAEGTESQIRLERIGPDILLGLYAGKFTALQFSLPPIGLYFGFREVNGGFEKKVEKTAEISVNVELQGDRIVNISKLLEDFGKDLTPGNFASQMCEGTEMVEFGVNW